MKRLSPVVGAGILVAATMLMASRGYAQPLPPIAADRPGQATVPTIAVPGTVELAMGMQLAGDQPTEGVKSQTLSVPFATARIGVLKTMELRLSGEFRQLNSTIAPSLPDTTVSGLASFTVGTKIGIAAEDGALPELSLQMAMAIPAGHQMFRPASLAPSFALLAHSTLAPDALNLYLNAGAAWDGASTEGFGTYAAALYYNITPAFSAFGELYGTMAPQLLPTYSLDGGVAYLVNNNLQVDLFGGVGLSNNAADYLVSAGFAWRVVGGGGSTQQ